MAARSFVEIAKQRGLPVRSRGEFRVPVRVVKTAPDKRLAWGWISVVTKEGKPVVDHDGDEIDVNELQAAAHRYVRESRVGKQRHRGGQTAELVDSIVFTADLQRALGIDLGCEGWFGGFYVRDDAHWEAVKAGRLPAFSIGGRGVRIPVED